MVLRPTVVANISGETRDLIRLLRASSRPNTYLADRHGLVDLFCAKVIFANQPLRDPASAGFPLELALPPTREYALPMDKQECQRVAAEFQPQLLDYRLRNHVKVTNAKIALDPHEFTPATQEVLRTFAACVVDDDELQSRIVSFLKPHDTQIQAELASGLTCILLEALLAACHMPRHKPLPLVELTKMVNTILAGRGDSLESSPETIGWQLRALGFHTEFIAGGRKGLQLLAETRARIHTLASAYGVRTLRTGVIKGLCELCDSVPTAPAESNASGEDS
jgi:hypothetical protein